MVQARPRHRTRPQGRQEQVGLARRVAKPNLDSAAGAALDEPHRSATSQQSSAFRERLKLANLAEFWAGWDTWRDLPRWWMAILVAFLVAPLLFVGGILISGLDSGSRQEDNLTRQCQFALERLGEGNLPPGCRERLGLSSESAP